MCSAGVCTYLKSKTLRKSAISGKDATWVCRSSCLCESHVFLKTSFGIYYQFQQDRSKCACAVLVCVRRPKIVRTSCTTHLFMPNSAVLLEAWRSRHVQRQRLPQRRLCVLPSFNWNEQECRYLSFPGGVFIHSGCSLVHFEVVPAHHFLPLNPHISTRNCSGQSASQQCLTPESMLCPVCDFLMACQPRSRKLGVSPPLLHY